MRVLLGLTLAGLVAVSLQALAEPQVETQTLQPTRFLERNLDLQGGDVVTWSASVQPANATVYFDIHSHDAEQHVQYHQQQNFTGALSGAFTVPAAGTYSWLVLNSHRQAIQATLSTEVNAPQGSPGGGPVPGPEVLLLAAGVVGALFLLRPPRRPLAARA